MMWRKSNNQFAARWTDGAIFCYKRGCRCEGCYVAELGSFKCVMKRTVIELVRKYGAPKSNKENEK